MNRIKVNIMGRLMGTALVAVIGFFTPVHAAQEEAVDIKVSMNASKDLSVSTTHYNFGSLAVNTSSVSATAITVTNASVGLLETYTIQGADALSTGAGTDWRLVASTGSVDEFKLAAQFSTTRPNNLDDDWTGDDLTTSAIACSATVIGNGTAAQSGQNVSPLAGENTRSLWFRLITPLVVSDTTQRNISVTLAVQ